MRVIAGICKGKKLAMPKGIRPTKDKVREAVFNMLSKRVDSASVLDLFAGSGALGIEALSRHAKEVVFVDNSNFCKDVIYDNITNVSGCGQLGSVRIIAKDAYAGIRFLFNEKKQFDIIFADPPYSKGFRQYADMAEGSKKPVFVNKNMIRKCLKYLSIYDILCHSGLVVIEHFKKDIVPKDTEHLVLARQLAYGDTVISVYNKK